MLTRVATAPAILPTQSARHDLLTLASVGIVACVLADMVHEALGHGIAALLTGDRILSLSTVAIQNAAPNRFLSAAGTLANCLVGGTALLLLRRAHKLTSAAYFLWIFGAFNLLNSGYLVVSALLNNGDWANVIAGLSPPWAWRCAIGITGAAAYALSLRVTARSMRRLVETRKSGLTEMQRLVLPAYFAGGAVMTIASIFNPISPTLILLSGVGASFGLNAGLLFLPAMIARNRGGESVLTQHIPMSWPWLALAAIFAGLFIVVLGPGIHFSK